MSNTAGNLSALALSKAVCGIVVWESVCSTRTGSKECCRGGGSCARTKRIDTRIFAVVVLSYHEPAEWATHKEEIKSLTGHVLSSNRLLLQPVTIVPEQEQTIATEKPFLI